MQLGFVHREKFVVRVGVGEHEKSRSAVGRDVEGIDERERGRQAEPAVADRRRVQLADELGPGEHSL